MDLKSCATTFEISEIWENTLCLFTDAVNENGRLLGASYSKPQLFSFYEDHISYPIDDLKECEDNDRIDFYEMISLMSWALYREWAKKVVDEKCQLDCFSEIQKDKTIQLFLDNLNCEEGEPLLKKLSV